MFIIRNARTSAATRPGPGSTRHGRRLRWRGLAACDPRASANVSVRDQPVVAARQQQRRAITKPDRSAATGCASSAPRRAFWPSSRLVPRKDVDRRAARKKPAERSTPRSSAALPAVSARSDASVRKTSRIHRRLKLIPGCARRISRSMRPGWRAASSLRDRAAERGPEHMGAIVAEAADQAAASSARSASE